MTAKDRRRQELSLKEQFEVVIVLNEGAKAVLDRAFHVNLRAMDALVRSRRDGSALRGFAEVSSQMRHWSRDLYGELERLSLLTRDTVEGVSRLAKHGRRVRILQEALAQSSGAYGVEKALSGLVQRRDAEQQALRNKWGKVQLALEDLNQLALMACVLSRSAMIEASAGSRDQRARLGQVSREFSEDGEEVTRVIKMLLKHSHGGEQ